MDIVFEDFNGNKKNFLYQYDKGQVLIVQDFDYDQAPKIEFSVPQIKTSLSVYSRLNKNTHELRADIPDSLIALGNDIVGYLYIDGGTSGAVVKTIYIAVVPRKMPADYVFASEMFATAIDGTIISEYQGVGEVAQWTDGNTDSEDRNGYFVSVALDDKTKDITISKATSLSNVHGVSVSKVGVATNCGKSLLDYHGDLDKKYAYVQTSGFTTVIDKGRCTEGGLCMPNSDGIAVPATNGVGFAVLSRIDSSHIYIFVTPSLGEISTFKQQIEQNVTNHKNDQTNPHKVTKAQVGLGNCDNTSDVDKPVSTAQAAAHAKLQSSIHATQKALDDHKADKKNPHEVTKAQVGLSEVPNVVTNDQTPTYTENASLVKLTSGEKLSTAFGKLSKAVSDFMAHIKATNPHNVTKGQVGLGNCDNTSDANKPVSTAQATAIADAKKAGTDAQSAIDTHAAKQNNPHKVTAAQVGLDKVNNTSDADKPVSTAQQAKFDELTKSINGAQGSSDAHASRTDNPHSVTKSQVGLGNVDNTSDVNKPISTATQTALDGKISADSKGLVPLDKIPSHASTHLAGGSDAIYSTVSVTLSVAGWADYAQTVDVEGVTPNNVVIVSPNPTYHDDYTNAKIKCLQQYGGKLKFTCKLTPETPILVNVLILGVNA